MAESNTTDKTPADGATVSPETQANTTDYEPGLVSIVIPVYNRECLIVEALGSVRAQTYRPIETVVVDDGSTDDTVGVCRQIANSWRTEPGIELRVLEQSHKGACAARNLGLRESRGEFIQFLDSDDLLIPDSIERRLQSMAPHIDAVFGDVLHMDKNGEVRAEWSYEDCPPAGADVTFHLAKNISTSCPIHRRTSILDSGGYDEGLSRGQETEFHARLLIMGRVFVYQSCPAYIFHCHGDGRISDRKWMRSDPFGYLRAFVQIRSIIARRLPVRHIRVASDQLSACMIIWGTRLIRDRKFLRAIPYFVEARRTGSGRGVVLMHRYGRIGRFVCSCVGVYWGEVLYTLLYEPCRSACRLGRTLYYGRRNDDVS